MAEYKFPLMPTVRAALKWMICYGQLLMLPIVRGAHVSDSRGQTDFKC